MDQKRFDALARRLGGATSRRGLARVLALSGAVPLLDAAFGDRELAVAKRDRRKKKRPQSRQRCAKNCADRVCGNDGCGGTCGVCAANQVCKGGECCTPESRGATCAGRCGTWTNNCGQPVVCATCPAGQQCLSNGSCAIACTTNNDCTGVCNGCSNPSVEGANHCIVGLLLPTITCTTTGDCPPGSHCQDIGFGGVCIELCN